jgi:hypothetical protein
VTLTSFSASLPRQILLDSKKKMAVSILFLNQFFWDMHQSTGENISLPQYEPFYQTLCIIMEVLCIGVDFSLDQVFDKTANIPKEIQYSVASL